MWKRNVQTVHLHPVLTEPLLRSQLALQMAGEAIVAVLLSGVTKVSHIKTEKNGFLSDFFSEHI